MLLKKYFLPLAFGTLFHMLLALLNLLLDDFADAMSPIMNISFLTTIINCYLVRFCDDWIDFAADKIRNRILFPKWLLCCLLILLIAGQLIIAIVYHKWFLILTLILIITIMCYDAKKWTNILKLTLPLVIGFSSLYMSNFVYHVSSYLLVIFIFLINSLLYLLRKMRKI